MMMKDEIANEMIRSRSQTPSPLRTEGGAEVTAGTTSGAGVSAAPIGRGSESISMRSYCIQNRSNSSALSGLISPGATSSAGATILAFSAFTITKIGGFHDTAPHAKQISISRTHTRVPPSRYAHDVSAMGIAEGRRRRPCIQCRSATQGNETAADLD